MSIVAIYLSTSSPQLIGAIIVGTDQGAHMNSTIQKEMGKDPAGGALFTSSSTRHQNLGRACNLQPDLVRQ